MPLQVLGRLLSNVRPPPPLSTRLWHRPSPPRRTVQHPWILTSRASVSDEASGVLLVVVCFFSLYINKNNIIFHGSFSKLVSKILTLHGLNFPPCFLMHDKYIISLLSRIHTLLTYALLHLHTAAVFAWIESMYPDLINYTAAWIVNEWRPMYQIWSHWKGLFICHHCCLDSRFKVACQTYSASVSFWSVRIFNSKLANLEMESPVT